jgi:hypothetical protein
MEGYSNIGTGRKVVTTAGTAVALVSTNTPCRRVDITAETDNTNPVVVGDANVVAAIATRKGTPLAAGATLTIYVDDLSKVYLDAVTSTEGVTFTYYY